MKDLTDKDRMCGCQSFTFDYVWGYVPFVVLCFIANVVHQLTVFLAHCVE